MPERGKTLRIALAVLLALLVVGAGVCAAGAILAPGWLSDAMFEGGPRYGGEPDTLPTRPIWERIASDLRAQQTTRLTGPELTALLREQLSDGDRARVTVDGDTGSLELSVDLSRGEGDPAWVNVHAVGRFTVEDGRFTRVDFDELDVSGWDMESWLGGRSAVQQLNAQLDQAAAGDPAVAERLAIVERIAFEDGAMTLTIAPEGVPYVQGPPDPEP